MDHIDWDSKVDLLPYEAKIHELEAKQLLNSHLGSENID